MSDNRPPIILYGRQTFCPDVARAKLRLEELGHEWIEYDIECESKRRQEVLELTGQAKVPTLVIGDKVLVEPATAQLDAALLAAGYEMDDTE
ncbi:MAG TPA: glutaredoxin domain-containing protein [Thermomicrobiales bacterium]|nr:glutaredoxin domain-containing protein [Thermomicrobiales bacterium]